jgi:hypothetical protein
MEAVAESGESFRPRRAALLRDYLARLEAARARSTDPAPAP